jgi:Fe-S-cluster containining protein
LQGAGVLVQSHLVENEMDLTNLAPAVRLAAGRSDVRQAVANLYADLAAEIDRRRPLCVISGRCCRFEEYGHRLFVTTMELAAFIADRPASGKSQAAWSGKGCPFQAEKLCTVHAIRPMGCRLFFCDASSMEWQQNQYEQFHSRLKRLHEEMNVPYFYVEWRQGLARVGLIARSDPGQNYQRNP